MRQPPKVMSEENIRSSTEAAKAKVKDLCDIAKNITTDNLKIERLKRHECRACFYTSRFGGAAVTIRSCMSCGKDEEYGSTATDVLCLDCAKKHNLCKHCGGDINMSTRARNSKDIDIEKENM